MKKITKKIIVLMGGWSQEREVSLASGRHVADALQSLYDDVQLVDIVSSDDQSWLKRLGKDCIVFNALHGQWGEDGTLQGLLTAMKIPYSHSGVYASAIAMNKHASASIARLLSIRVPQHELVTQKKAMKISASMQTPFVLKPLNEGSSVGVFIVRSQEELPSIIEKWRYGDQLMLQQWIDGRELTVGILNDEPLDVMEIIPAQNFYDYKAKYDDQQTQYHIPAEVPPVIAKQATEWARALHQTLGCRCVSRADFLFDEKQGEEGLYFLELNTQPGLTSHSLLPAMAAHKGISFAQLVQHIVEAV